MDETTIEAVEPTRAELLGRMVTYRRAFGSLLRHVRSKHFGIDVEQMARTLDMPPGDYSDLENADGAAMTDERFRQIATVLGIE